MGSDGMSLRVKMRALSRLGHALTVPDRSVALPGGAVVLYSCHDVDRSMVENGKRFSPLLDGIRRTISELGFQAVNLSHPFALFPGSTIRGGSMTMNYRALAMRARAFVARLVSRGGGPTARLDLETAFYGRLLGKINPAMVMAIQPPAGLCRAARQRGVLVAEAMHGSNYSLNNKLFAAHMAVPDDHLPNVLISFDDVSHATMTTICAGRDITALRANDPWLHSLRMARGTHSNRSPAHGGEHGGRKTVLITLQWGYDGERDFLSNIIPNGILHPVLEDVFAQGRDAYQFLVRMHPIQMNQNGYRHHRHYIEALPARFPNVSWLEASTRPLPLLLDEAIGHITMSSSSVGEAAATRVPSLMRCPTRHKGGAQYGYFRELEAEGMVTFGTLEAEPILAWIARCGSSDKARASYDVEGRQAEELAFYRALLERAHANRLTYSRTTA
jgi:hypothetical protein